MVVDSQSSHRFLQLDRGSAVVEGMVAMALSFLLLALLVQVAVLVGARASAQAAVDGFARRAAAVEALGDDHLREQLARSLPGADGLEAAVIRGSEMVVAEATFVFDPPGPRLLPITVVVRGVAPVISPP